MAGRCISCGECARACPVDIPLALLSIHLNDEVEAQFGERPGFRADFDYPLSSFKVEDKEKLHKVVYMKTQKVIKKSSACSTLR